MKFLLIYTLVFGSLTSFAQTYDCGVTATTDYAYNTREDLYGLSVHKNGDLYYSNIDNNDIYKNHKVWLNSNIFSFITQIVVDDSNNLYVFDAHHNQIFKIDQDKKTSLIAGVKNSSGTKDGHALEATFTSDFTDIAFSKGAIYMSKHHSLRRLVLKDSIVETLSLPALDTFKYGIQSMTADPFGNLYFTDGKNIWKKDSLDKTTTYFIAKNQFDYVGHIDDSLQKASFGTIRDIFYGWDNNLYVLTTQERIRRIAPNKTVTTLAGYKDGIGTEGYLASFEDAKEIIQLPNHDVQVICENFTSEFVKSIHRNTDCNNEEHRVSTIWRSWNDINIKDKSDNKINFRGISSIATASNGDIYISEIGRKYGKVLKLDTNGKLSLFYTGNPFDGITGVAISDDGLLAVKYGTKLEIVNQNGEKTKSFSSSNDMLFSIHGMKFHPNGDLYFADGYYHNIKKINLTTDEISIYAGGTYNFNNRIDQGFEDGNLTTARFDTPKYLDITDDGIIYINDSGNFSIRKISNGKVTTLVTDPNNTDNLKERIFKDLKGIKVIGDKVYVVDKALRQIKTIDISTLEVDVLVGTVHDLNIQHNRYVDGIISIARFSSIDELVVTPKNELLVLDGNNIRKISRDLSSLVPINDDFTSNKVNYSVYPNPSSHYLKLESKEQFTILDLQMRVIKSGNSDNINISELNTGTYILQILSKGINTKFYKF